MARQGAEPRRVKQRLEGTRPRRPDSSRATVRPRQAISSRSRAQTRRQDAEVPSQLLVERRRKHEGPDEAHAPRFRPVARRQWRRSARSLLRPRYLRLHHHQRVLCQQARAQIALDQHGHRRAIRHFSRRRTRQRREAPRLRHLRNLCRRPQSRPDPHLDLLRQLQRPDCRSPRRRQRRPRRRHPPGARRSVRHVRTAQHERGRPLRHGRNPQGHRLPAAQARRPEVHSLCPRSHAHRHRRKNAVRLRQSQRDSPASRGCRISSKPSRPNSNPNTATSAKT